jgi:hypothetical protein
VCTYDVKTGTAGLTPKRVGQIYTVVVKKYPGGTIYIIEIRPFN